MVIFEPDQIGFATLGGLILGIATSLNYILRGKVTGMSGIVYGIISINKSELPQKLSIVGGMLLISAVFYLIFGQNNYSGFEPFGPQNQIAQWTTYPGFALAGLLVGFGTKFSNGCTSGHGLCGMARLSIRSFVAVGTFLTTAIVIGTISYQANGLGPFDNDPSLNPQKDIYYNHSISSLCFIPISLLFPIIGFIIKKKTTPREKFDTAYQIKDQLIVFMVGLLFSIGLMVAGMTRRINILEFLWIGNQWNPALMFVLGSGLFVNLITFQYMIRHRGKPILGQTLFNPQVKLIDFKLVFGAFIFGLGWGIGGLCPGPFIVLFSTFTIGINLIWGSCLFIGMIIAAKVTEMMDTKQKEKKQQLSQTQKKLVDDRIQVQEIEEK